MYLLETCSDLPKSDKFDEIMGMIVDYQWLRHAHSIIIINASELQGLALHGK